MDFSSALRLADASSRNSKIEEEIYNYEWSDTIEDHLHHGGWPDDLQVEKVEIADEDEDEIIVIVWIAFSESVPSGCKDINHDYPMTCYFNVIIDKESGDYEIEDLDVEEVDDSSDDVDFYPDDYN